MVGTSEEGQAAPVKAKKVRDSKRRALIQRDLQAIERVQSGAVRDETGVRAIWAWLPVSCPKPKGDGKRAFGGRIVPPEGQEEHQEALVALLVSAAFRAGVVLGDLGWTDARASLVVVLPLPRSGKAETPRPSRKATLLIPAEPRRQPKVADLDGYRKMIHDALEKAGFVDDDVAISQHGASSKEWVGFRMPMGSVGSYSVSSGWRGMLTHERQLTEPGYLVGLERLS